MMLWPFTYLYEMIYGEMIYFEEHNDNWDNIISIFLNKNYRKEYKFFNNHPFYKDAYNYNLEKFAEYITTFLSKK